MKEIRADAGDVEASVEAKMIEHEMQQITNSFDKIQQEIHDTIKLRSEEYKQIFADAEKMTMLLKSIDPTNQDQRKELSILVVQNMQDVINIEKEKCDDTDYIIDTIQDFLSKRLAYLECCEKQLKILEKRMDFESTSALMRLQVKQEEMDVVIRE